MYPKLFSDLERKTNHIQRFLLVRNSRLKKNYVKCKMKLLWLFYYSLLRAKAKTGDGKKITRYYRPKQIFTNESIQRKKYF